MWDELSSRLGGRARKSQAAAGGKKEKNDVVRCFEIWLCYNLLLKHGPRGDNLQHATPLRYRIAMSNVSSEALWTQGCPLGWAPASVTLDLEGRGWWLKPS